MREHGVARRTKAKPLIPSSRPLWIGDGNRCGNKCLDWKGGKRAQQVPVIIEAPVPQECFKGKFLIDPSENDQIVPRE